MVDIVDSKTRSKMMSGIRAKNTKPEILIRKALHKQGFRFRLHDKNLPGNPDIVLRRYNVVIFINGCFWHRHNCVLFKWPSENRDFWTKKINRNAKNDTSAQKSLLQLGWRVLVVWECSLKGKAKLPFDKLISKIEAWIKSGKTTGEFAGKAISKGG
ncbi:MAG: DNA mismatch endonuclease Vsr [Alphaproteobacteria bacterium]|nr:DNA mismatch endonuclease Vsr [Alphaproteobacteria bacterium]